MTEDEKKDYKADYMQDPCNILTKENLDRLEKHCKKAINYERGNIRKEHEVVLALLYKYQDSVPKEAIREKIRERELQKFLGAEIISDRIFLDGEIFALKELLEE